MASRPERVDLAFVLTTNGGQKNGAELKINMQIHLDSELAITQWQDEWGTFQSKPVAGNLHMPAMRLVRHDDAWRPLAASAIPSVAHPEFELQATWRDVYGGDVPFCRPADIQFPNYWPATFDDWPYANDFHLNHRMAFEGNVQVKPVQTSRARGMQFTITLEDRRDPQQRHPQNIVRLPVGIELPLTPSTKVFGTKEMYYEHARIHTELRDPHLPRRWYYLEGELFGLRTTSPMLEPSAQPGRSSTEIHTGAPLAACSDDGKLWWGLASEPDYGAAIDWASDRVRLYTTLYLQAGGKASWSFIVWRMQTDRPQDLLVAATESGGFFDLLNPLGFEPKGVPSGPIIFANYSRIRLQWDQIKALRPGLLLINYHYDHISSTANLYGRWKTYEGFEIKEEDLKSLVNDLKSVGMKVGFYGSTVEQPESHKIIQQSDFVMDKWGRRWHAWEPGNWVIDAGNRGAAERIARAEAEFAHHYGMDAVFVDRLDHMGVNHNPERVGDADAQGRLALIPSVRLGLIHLNKARLHWQRKLNPHLCVALNNTTLWAGVRHSDFNLLEGGDDIDDYSMPWLFQPSGVVNKRHFSVLFSELAGSKLFQAIGQSTAQTKFLDVLRIFIRRSLVSGVIAQPYGDEIFVDQKSMFFQPLRDKNQPDEMKFKMLESLTYDGGDQWRQWWDHISPALDAARQLAMPTYCVSNEPELGSFGFSHRFLARQGKGGGVYIGLLNESDQEQNVSFRVFGHEFRGIIPTGSVKAWWVRPDQVGTESLTF